MSSSNLIDKSDYFQGNAAELFPGHRMAASLGYGSYPYEEHENKHRRLTPGTVLKGFGIGNPSGLELRPKSKQPRVRGTCSSNQESVKNQIEEEGVNNPAFVTKCPVSGKLYLEHGHHRYYSCKQLKIDIPYWIVEFDNDLHPEGLDARDEFNQFHNKKEAGKSHELATDGLHYLNQVKDKPNYFTKQFAIQDEAKRTKALKARANEILKRHYSAYSPQARGGVIRKWLKGVVVTKVDNPVASIVKEKFTDNNWCSVPIDTYDFSSNTFSYLIQMGKVGGYVGLAEDRLRSEMQKVMSSQAEPDNILTKFTVEELEDHFKKVEIEAVAYTTSAKDENQLTEMREKFLETIAKINKDTIFSPNTLITRVLFNPQLLQPTEEKVPVIYEWDKTLEEFVKVQ